jgi:[ribosomal protein S5]-alanine N-acetyltransferase
MADRIPRLHTARLVLRPLEVNDVPAVFEGYAQDSEVVRYLTWRPHATPNETRAVLERMLAACEDGSRWIWAITLRGDDTLRGMIELRPQGHKAEVAYVLARDLWGHGLMTEAVGEVLRYGLGDLGFWRIWAVVDPENLGSARVLEKAGMTREGRLARWAMLPNRDAEPRDVVCFAVAR